MLDHAVVRVFSVSRHLFTRRTKAVQRYGWWQARMAVSSCRGSKASTVS